MTVAGVQERVNQHTHARQALHDSCKMRWYGRETRRSEKIFQNGFSILGFGFRNYPIHNHSQNDANRAAQI